MFGDISPCRGRGRCLESGEAEGLECEEGLEGARGAKDAEETESGLLLRCLGCLKGFEASRSIPGGKLDISKVLFRPGEAETSRSTLVWQ